MTALIKSHPALPLATTLAPNCIQVAMATDSKMEREASDWEKNVSRWQSYTSYSLNPSNVASGMETKHIAAATEMHFSFP